MESKALHGARGHNDFVKLLLAGPFRVSDTEAFSKRGVTDPFQADPASPKLALISTWVSSIVCVVALSLMLHSPDRASVIERPTQSSVLGLFGAGAILIVASFLVRGSTAHGNVEDAIPLAGGEDDLEEIRIRGLPTASFFKKLWASQNVSFPLLAIAIMLRLHTFESVKRNLQCGVAGVEAFVPLITALLDYGVFSSANPQSILDELSARERLLRGVGPSVLVAWANNLVWRVAASPRSNLICPATSGTTRWVILMQLSGLLLDGWMLHTIPSLLASLQHRVKMPAKRTPLLLGLLFIVSAGLIAMTGLMTAILPRYRAVLNNLHSHYLNNLYWETSLFVTLCLFGSHWVSTHKGTDLAVLLSLATSGYQIWPGWANALQSRVPQLYLPTLPPTLLLIFGTCLYFYSTRHSVFLDSGSWSRYYRTFLLVLCAGILGTTIFRSIFGVAGSPLLEVHPIDTLINQANERHDAWTGQALQSMTLEQAVENYRQRYGRHPPPGFDKWYRYATERNSLVIDDFDLIEQNLRPFWKLDPRNLRMRVRHLLVDQTHDCAEITIRNNEATIGNVRPTHRWMVEGIIIMMKPFMKELPDMNIAFNINDEPRVSVPYETWQILDKQEATSEQASQLSNQWETNRAKSWEIPEGEVLSPIKMQVNSFKRIWRMYGAVMCPPDSPAWTQHFWDSTVRCAACYAPHSYEQFISNWTLADNPCHQPDLANLHGFYLSPSAFNPTSELLPIFSQSRAGGFADILYPTAWNYNDKVKHDPKPEHPDDDFEKKEATLFWHGTATEGFSSFGSWRAQARQRLVHLVNNSTMKSNVLLPEDKGFRYRDLTTEQFLAHPRMRAANLTTDVGFVDHFPRCDNGDCEAQEAAFGLGKPTDFQHHWRHRYLLDADGAGFSGRFLPFLQSHSIPFKTAIFREWYDSRLTAWKHFVPVDIRMHGLWSTLAYFAGGFGTKKGVDPGRKIAEEGRAWANKVLRKEDMEIYLYRLLLEYARVMSDDRAKLGYKNLRERT